MKEKSRKSKSIHLSEEDSTAISMALIAYAHAAYPPGGSECSQASHQTLLDYAERIKDSMQKGFEIKKRQLPLFKAAINWYYSKDNSAFTDKGVQPEDLIRKLTH